MAKFWWSPVKWWRCSTTTSNRLLYLKPTAAAWRILVIIRIGIASRDVLEHSFTFEPVSSRYVKEILDNLNPRKALGADGISPRLLRLLAPVMAEEITRLAFRLLIALNQTYGSAAIWHPCSKRMGTHEKRTIVLCRSLQRCQRSMRKLCTINFLTLSVATCHETSLDF